jgi:hypothetical protein
MSILSMIEEANTAHMTFLQTYLIVAAGIAISFLLPLLKKAWEASRPSLADSGQTYWSRFWSKVKPYFLIAIISLVTAILVMAIAGDGAIPDWQSALLLGYAWDSTLQKVGS